MTVGPYAHIREIITVLSTLRILFFVPATARKHGAVTHHVNITPAVTQYTTPAPLQQDSGDTVRQHHHSSDTAHHANFTTVGQRVTHHANTATIGKR